MILPNADRSTAISIAERLRIDFMEVQAGNKKSVCTISLGVAQMMASDSPEGLLQRADEALYLAKAQGKNRVVFKEV